MALVEAEIRTTDAKKSPRGQIITAFRPVGHDLSVILRDKNKYEQLWSLSIVSLIDDDGFVFTITL